MPVKIKAAVLCVVTLVFLISGADAQTTVPLSGYCDTISNAGQQFVLNGLGQRSQSACTYGPGSPNPSVFLGELVNQNGTIRNLYVKQSRLNSGVPMGGTVVIWVNKKTGGAPVNTFISCTPTFYTNDLWLCNNTSTTYSVVAGDRVIAIVTPPSGTTMNPVSASLDLVTSTTTLTPILGKCDSVSYAGQAFVLNGLGQRSTTACTYGPGNPVSPMLGEVVTKSGTLKNLYVKQPLFNWSTLGGTVTVWVNPKTGAFPVQTSISCTLTGSGDLYLCNNTASTHSVVVGDRVIVIATPPGSVSASPVIASIDLQ